MKLLTYLSPRLPFQDAANRMGVNLSRSSGDIEQFRALARTAKARVDANAKKDEEYEDAPDEFIGASRRGLPFRNIALRPCLGLETFPAGPARYLTRL